MPKEPNPLFDEKKLSKGHLRKLTTLRKSLGDDIANKAFAEWYATLDSKNGVQEDTNAELIASTLWPLVETKKLMIPRKGYLVKRGRGRLVVTSADNA